MKRRYRRLLTAVLAVLLLGTSVTACAPRSGIRVIELGIPAAARYEEGIRARSPLDMLLWEGDLYVGSGDYDVNMGPVDIWCYHVTDLEWACSAPLPEEEISRFCVLDGTPAVPGIDPKEDWSLGNFYILEDGEWVQKRTLPGGLHNFDLVSYDGRLFAGLGVRSGDSPVVASSDGGETFEPVLLYKNGEPVDTENAKYSRVYDFFVLEDSLYAVFYHRFEGQPTDYDLYRYEDGCFRFDNSWSGKINRVNYTYSIIGAKAVYDNTAFFTTGYLYATDDMNELVRINFPASTVVCDLYRHGDRLYALCGVKQEDGTVQTSVWVYDGNEALTFTKLFSLTDDVPPLSLACDGYTFFIGMGHGIRANDKNGLILQVEYYG